MGQEMQLQLRDADRRSEALAASRDHFRGKVEELCRRLLRSPPPASATMAGYSMPAEMPEMQAGTRQSLSLDAAERSAEVGINEMTQGLRKMQDHLAELAR